jgi:RNA polymerase sigma-70 factor, ECF subfamily
MPVYHSLNSLLLHRMDEAERLDLLRCRRHDFDVRPQSQTNDAPQHETEATTLGELLYENPAQRPMSEALWAGMVRSIAAGDQCALHSIYELTHRIVFTLIMRIINNRETAEELTLDVYHDVWRRASTYDPANGSVVGWIVNQARSRAIDRLRYEQRKKRVNTDTSPSPNGGASVDPQQALHSDEQARLLQNALEILNTGERQAIEMAFFAELTYPEVASRLKQPLGTIKSRIRSGLSKLRNTLADRSEEL